MKLLSIDYRLGWRHADEMLADRAARQAEVLVAGLPKWKENTAENLIAAAVARKDEGINTAYQDGVIARSLIEISGEA